MRYIPRLCPLPSGCSVYTSGKVTKGPPSECQEVSKGSSVSFGGALWTSRIGPFCIVLVPTLSPSNIRLRIDQILSRLGGISVSAARTISFTNCCGLFPKASSMRRFVPNRLVTTGNWLLATLVNSRAGPPWAITLRCISAISRYGSTWASISSSSDSFFNICRNAGRSSMIPELTFLAPCLFDLFCQKKAVILFFCQMFPHDTG